MVLKITKTRTGTREESRKSFRATRALTSTRLSQAGRISVTTKPLRKHAPDSRAHRAIANAARLHPDDILRNLEREFASIEQPSKRVRLLLSVVVHMQ